MADKKTKTREGKGKIEQYLKVPYHILNIPSLGIAEKSLLAHIYSFGSKGCWQSNETLGKMFMFTPRTISKYIARLVKKDLVQIKCPKGYYRTIWAKSHPEVKMAAQIWYRGKMVENSANPHRTKQRSQLEKKGNRLSNNVLTTNNTTIRDTIRETSATPSPLPARGQAPALLTERKKQIKVDLEQFKQKFGIGKKKFKPMSEQEFQNRRQAQMKALFAQNSLRK